MSGFLAAVAPPGAPAELEPVRRLTEEMAFRGPDGRHAAAAGRAALGHALLRVDRSDPPQPLSVDGAWIVADARIDARDELRDALLAAGRTVPAGTTDAHLILHAYHAWGTACAERLLGDFSFAVWDEARQRLFCARDPLGTRMLYWARAGGTLLAGNTLDVLRAWPGLPAELDETAIGDFLAFGAYHDAAATAYAAVRCVPPGHVLVAEGGSAAVRRFWTLPEVDELRLSSPEAYAERFSELFARAVCDRRRGARSAVLLSGGRDSTAVAATAVHRCGGGAHRFQAHTFVYERLLPDREGHFAALAAEALGMPQVLHPVDGYRPLDRWEALPVPEPTADPLVAGFHDAYASAARFAPAGLTGHGGDILLRESRSRLARLAARGRLVAAAREALEYRRVHGRVPRPGVRTLLRRAARGGGAPRWPLPAWLEPEFAARTGLRERWEAHARAVPVGHPRRPELAQQLASPLLSRQFEAYDAGFHGAPIAFGHPFLDLRLVAFVLAIPPRQWYNDKGLLRLSMRGLLPDAVLLRPKAPLAGEPNETAIRAAGAAWGDGPHLESRVNRFVDVARVPRFARGTGEGAVADAWVHLRVPALSLWLGTHR